MNKEVSKTLLSKLSGMKRRTAVYKRVKAKAPSSTANLGPGFDVFGLALDLFHDLVEIELVPEHGVTLTVEGLDRERVSLETRKNTAGLVASIVMDATNREEGLTIKLMKGVPVAKGLGGSASSAAACIVALNEIFGLSLSSEELVALAAWGEIASAGIEHFDNIAAATLGGFVIVSQEPLKLTSLQPPPNMEVAVAIPNIELPKNKTKMMRDILPKTVNLGNMTHNVAMASLLVAGIGQGDVRMVGEAMSDSVVEPVRSKEIPMFDSVRRAAFESGACGFAISGAGPSVIAICDGSEVNTNDVIHAMKEAFERGGVPSEAYASKPSGGATVVERQ